MSSGNLLLYLVTIPLVFMLGRMSTRIAVLKVKAQKPESVSTFLRNRNNM
ncbi:MAG: hypothetical protein WCC10_01370 [Tumebacillaceae bacterium]